MMTDQADDEQPRNPESSRGRSFWRQWQRALTKPSVDQQALDQALEQALEQARAREQVPMVWLLGSAQSGKSSIIRALTGSDRAEIGDGFQPCTRTAEVYDFPAQAPVVRFLDTRGLGEVDYDPSADIAQCEARAHQLVVVIKVTETRPAALISVLQTIRRQHPDWPVVIAQTCLHEAWSTQDDSHKLPYPFADENWPEQVPAEMARLIQAQREAVGALPGRGPVYWVPLDFTQAEDQIEPRLYGLEALWSALEDTSALGLKARLLADSQVIDVYASSAHPHIMGHSLAAATVGALPLVDLAAVPALQLRMLHVLAELYGLRWTRRHSVELIGLLGGGLAVGYGLRMAGRSLLKLIPGWGQTAGAVWGAGASSAMTFALGKTACVYLQRRREGQEVDAQRLRQTWAESLDRGRQLLKQREPER